MPNRQSLYQQAVKISQDFLGPAGERFMRRQISTHIGVEPEQLRKKDIPQLVNWSGLAFALLTNDKKEVESFTSKLFSLSKANTSGELHARNNT